MQTNQNPVAGLSPLKQALLAIETLQRRLAELERAAKEPIAIVGMGCRFPSGNGLDAFWRLLQSGGDAITEVPESRWSLEDYSSGGAATRWGGFLDQVDQFDPEFFGISPREAHMMDPQQRLLLEVVWEALENGAQGPADLVNGKTGIFVGLASDEFSQRVFCEGDLSTFNAYFPTGVARSVAGGRISYTLGLDGPNFAIDTACSSSLVAVHNACLYLRQGHCRMALAGGVNVILSPQMVHSFANAHMMSADGRCKAFDERADGFVRSEGCGIIVLKRLSDALADHDRIQAVIRGSAINQDGHSAGLTVPSVKAQESVIRDALTNGGLSPDQIDYIEAHGTGTSLGDPIEARALARVFASGRSPEHPLVVGSVKTNIGHLEAAAGVSGIIKTVLAMQQEEIPVSVHFRTMNPHIDWGALPVEIPTQNRKWRRGAAPRMAGVSSFGFSGTNAHVVLQEAPTSPQPAAESERPLHVLAISAHTSTALAKVSEQYLREIAKPDASLADICFSANACHAHFAHRVAVVGGSAAEISSRLVKQGAGHRVRAAEYLKPVFLFPGQGSQYVGMGKELYASHPEFRRLLDQCADLLKSELSVPLTEVLWGSSSHLLDETTYTQPALFALEYALAGLWRSWGIEPAAVLGHSIGEYVAACVAGVLNLPDGLKLIAARGRLMQGTKGNGAMAAVFAGEERVHEALDRLSNRISVAALNAPEKVVISGYADAVEAAEGRLRSRGVQVQRLKVSHAFHSPQMDEIADAFAAIAGGLSYAPPQMKWVSSMTGSLMGPRDASNRDYWRRQVREPVRFRSAIETLNRPENIVFLEIGPGSTLSALGPQTVRDTDRMWLPSLRTGRGEWQQVLDSLARLYMCGAEINWRAFDRPYDRRRVGLPPYPFERQRYWFEAVRPAKPTSRAVAVEQTEAPAALGNNSFFELIWEDTPGKSEPVSVAGDWLIVADRSGVGQDLANQLSAAGGRVSLVQAADDIKAAAKAKSWSGAVFLRALDAPAAAQLNATSLENSQRDLFGAVLDLVQGLSANSSGQPPRLWLVTRGGQPVSDNAVVEIAQSPIWGCAKAIIEEHPEWNCACIDLDPDRPGLSGAALLAELLVNDGEDSIALRNQQRLAMRIVGKKGASPSEHPVRRVTPDGTYLITGGFGALGQHVARWLIEQGARTLVLSSRSASSTANGGLIDWAASRGVHIVPYGVDISNYSEAEHMISMIAAKLPPLRGVVHAAGVLDDGILTQQTSERFDRVLAPKVLGSWNLHQLTSSLPLDFFVLFSSIAATVAAPGQGNYAAANAFEDALGHFRSQLGLRSTSIAWGAWSDGMAADQRLEDKRRGIGIETMSADEALQLFAAADGPYVIAGKFDWDRFASRYQSRPVLKRFVYLISEPAGETGDPGESELLRQLSDSSPSRVAILRDFLQKLAVRVLGFSADREIDPAQPLQELGLDSLMAVEFRNILGDTLQQSFPATLLFSYPSLDDLEHFLTGLLWGGPPLPDQTPAPKSVDLLDHVEQLSDEELDRILAEKSGASQ